MEASPPGAWTAPRFRADFRHGMELKVGERSAAPARTHRIDGLGPAREPHVQVVRRPRPPAHRRRARPRSGLAPPRKAVTAAPLAPVPEESVSPTPRSKIRARTRLPSIFRKETLVRFGNSSWPSISGPIATRSSSSSSSPTLDRALRVADRDVLEVPIASCGAQRPACRPPAGGEVLRGGRRPYPSRPTQVSSEVIVGTIGPAAVPIAKVSSSVQPCRRR